MSDANFQAQRFKSRSMEEIDLKAVLAIERTTQISPWSRLLFEEALTRSAQSLSASKPSQMHFCRVAFIGDELVGFHVCSSVVDELHILNLAIAKKYQGMGLGHGLMQDILSISTEWELNKVFLEVRKSNTVAQQLYQKWQFKHISVRKHYYSPSQGNRTKSAEARNNAGNTERNQREDALIYVRELGR